MTHIVSSGALNSTHSLTPTWLRGGVQVTDVTALHVIIAPCGALALTVQDRLLARVFAEITQS